MSWSDLYLYYYYYYYYYPPLLMPSLQMVWNLSSISPFCWHRHVMG